MCGMHEKFGINVLILGWEGIFFGMKGTVRGDFKESKGEAE